MDRRKLTNLTLDEINSETDRIANIGLDGDGYGAPEAKEADDRKLQVLMNLREQKLVEARSKSNNPDRPGLSAISHLIPLTEVKHLDADLWERCRYSLSAGGDDPKAWDKAVRTATVILEERLRKLGDIDSINSDATGSNIVNMIFGSKNSVLSGKLKDKELQGYRDLYSGVMTVFRNPYGHRIIDPAPEVGGAILVFIDLLLKMLDDIDWSSVESQT